MAADSVLVVTPITGGFYFGEVIAGLHREEVRAGRLLVIQQTYDAGSRTPSHTDAPAGTTPVAWDRVAGTVVLSNAVDRSYLERLRLRGLPVVQASGELPLAGIASAAPDNAGGAAAAVRHLVEHGHTRIGFVGYLENADMRERYAGYHEALLELGLEPDPAHFVAVPDHTEASGERAADQLFMLDEPPTAVFAATDRNAIGLIHGLTRCGLSVPDDVAVVGFDNIEAGAYCVPSLTTVDQPFHVTGAVASRILQAVAAGHDPADVVVEAAQLALRSSCGCTGEAAPRPAARRDVAHPPAVVTDRPVDVLRRGLGAALEEDTDGPCGHDDASCPMIAVEVAAAAVAGLVTESVRAGTPATATQLAGALQAVTEARLLSDGLDRSVEAVSAYLRAFEAGLPALAVGARAVSTGLRSRLPAALSYLHAGQYLRRAHAAESSLLEQHDVSLALLGHSSGNPRWLNWMTRTTARAAVLTLWREDRLVVEGVYDPNRTLLAAPGDSSGPEEFPPADLLEAARPEAGEAVYVIPVRARGRDWGLLAVVGSVDESLRRESYNQWAALLCASFEQEELAQSLRSSEERYGLLASAMNEGLWDWDLASTEVNFSARCSTLLGLDHVPVPERSGTWLRGVHPDDLEPLLADLRRTADRGTPLAEFEFRYRGPSDTVYRWLLGRAMPFRSQPGDRSTRRLLGSLSDNTHRKHLEEELRRNASVDAITGLANRRTFLERLGESIRRAEHGTPFAVVFLDLDRFKVINDSLGHQTGDRLLRAVSERLQEAVRPGDTPARFGGDEFAVLLDGVPAEHVPQVVHRIRESLARPVEVTGHSLWVSASLGIALSSTGYETAEDVLRDADTAMYDAKVRERGSVSYFDSSMHDAAVHHLWLQDQVQRALERQEFEVHYQPIVELADEPLSRFEALVRWRHPERGLVPPSEFLPLMEETGLIVPLGRWIVEQVATDLERWRRGYDGPVAVSVNLSDREFWDADLVPAYLATLQRHGLEPGNLALEITERVIARSPELADQMVQAFRDAGLSLHIDDFGTGHSSLQTLQRYPVDALKIDRSFVQDLSTDPRAQELVRAIIAMGRALSLDVIAEGVETVEQMRTLRSIGCASAQGYLFSKAVPAEQAREMLGRAVPVLAHEGKVLPVRRVPAVGPVPAGDRSARLRSDEDGSESVA